MADKISKSSLSDVKWSSFLSASSLSDSDQFVGLQSGNNVRAALIALFTYIQNKLSLFSWQIVTSTTQQMQINTGYIVKSMSTVNFVLPPTNSGSGLIEIIGTGRASWLVSVNAGQYIQYNGVTTTIGTGSVNSGTPNDSARIIYGGDGSGEFDIFPTSGMELIFF